MFTQTRRRSLHFLLALILPVAGWAAEPYPSRPIKLVVPFAPGGAADATARMVGEVLSKRLGQPVVVDNKPGGGATTGAAFVVNAPADGYTLLYTTPGPQITNPYLMKGRLPYATTDLVPVSRIAWDEAGALDVTARGAGGFGSSGRS